MLGRVVMTFELESNAHFPDAETIRNTWGFGALTVEPMRKHHGAQVVLRPADGGAWVLKHCRVDGMSRHKLDATLVALESAGARLDPSFVPVIRPVADGRHVLKHNKQLYYVMALVEGRRPSFRREREVAAVLAALGRLHARGHEAAAKLGRSLKEPLTQSVSTIWHGQVESFEWLSSKISRRGEGLTAAGRLFADRNGAFAELAIEADAYLHAQVGDVTEAQCSLVLAHGDSYENNYMLAKDSDAMPWLLDLESVSLKPAPSDLVVPLATFGLAHRWNPDKLRRLIDVYEKERRLDPVERALLRAMLMFPRQWTRSMHCLVRRREQQKLDWGTMRNLTNCILALPAHRRLVEEIKNGW
ncbi:MAG: hypothetical protein ABFD69_12475 [Candidatus Sumerlaeia bacterium]